MERQKTLETIKTLVATKHVNVSGGGPRGHSGGVVRARPLNASGGEWRGWEPEVNGGPKFSL